jgi:hypothetical protein
MAPHGDNSPGNDEQRPALTADYGPIDTPSGLTAMRDFPDRGARGPLRGVEVHIAEVHLVAFNDPVSPIEQGQSSRPGGRGPRLAGASPGQLEAAALIAVPVLLLAQWLLALLLDAAIGPAAWTVYLAVALVLISLVMFVGDLERSIPTVVPTAVAAVAAVILASEGSPWAVVVVVAAAVWLGAWIVAWGRLWTIWTRLVLRRQPIWEDPFAIAYGSVHEHLHSAASVSDVPAVWAEALAMNEYRSLSTAPLIDGTLAEFDLGARESDSWRAERLFARLLEERRAYEALPDRHADRDAHPERPTRGMRLEFLFPELEALLAAATPAQQRRMAVEAARIADQRAGILDDELAAVLDRAAAGHPDADAYARFQPDATPPASDHDGNPMSAAVEGARLATWFALADGLDPTDAAEGIYEAVRSMEDSELDAFVAVAGSMLDAAARARVTQVEPDPGCLKEVRDRKSRPPAEEMESAALLPWGRSLGEVALIGLVAGAVGTAFRVPFAPLLEPLPHSGSLDNLLGLVLVALVAWLSLRAMRRPTGAAGVLGLYLASWLATVLLVEPIEAAIDALLSRLAPGSGDRAAVRSAARPRLCRRAPWDGDPAPHRRSQVATGGRCRGLTESGDRAAAERGSIAVATRMPELRA